ncbi:hypothetical protein RHS04_07269 [Rhizoctonia solani]|uniref:Uncharacterized protein n=1 Tax=Rhizoctonia solani TaxID=456999 RepID=A0A8H7LHM0_9AGAM|nr:hypothetical protein RHS04_07269 [Rhizoctonia solani]
MLSSQHEAQQASLQRIEEFAQYIVRNNLQSLLFDFLDKLRDDDAYLELVSHTIPNPTMPSRPSLPPFLPPPPPPPPLQTSPLMVWVDVTEPALLPSLKNEGVLPSDFLHPYSYRETAIGPSFIISTPTTPFPHEGRTSMYAALPTTASSSASVAGGSGRSRERRSSLSRGPKLAADSTLTPTQVPGSAATSIGVTKKGEKRKMAEVNRGPEGPSTSIGQSSGPKAKVPKLKHN